MSEPSKRLNLPQRLAAYAEHGLEWCLFASRWLLAPLYLGLALSLFVLLAKFAKQLYSIVRDVPTASEADTILGVLGLVDVTLIGSLIVIVVLSGYENFVSKIDLADRGERPEWMGTIDFSGLKLKLLASIVAISAIQVLRLFMDLKDASDRELMWSVGIHFLFVISSVLLALSDRIAAGTKKGHGE